MLIGKLMVELGVVTSGFGKSLQSASEAVEKVSRKMAEMGQKFGHLGVAVAGVGALMLRSAAEGSTAIAHQFDRLKGAWAALAADVGRLLLPALTEVADYVGRVVKWWKELDPAVKASAVKFAEFAAAGLAIVAVVGRIAGLIGALSPIISAIGAVVGAGLLGPILAVVAAVVAVVALAGVLYDVYTRNADAIGKALSGAFDWAAEAAKNYFQFMLDNVRSLARLFLGFAETAISAAKAIWSITPLGLAGAKNPALEVAGMLVGTLRETVESSTSELVGYVKTAGAIVGKAGADIGSALGEGLAKAGESSVRGLKKLFADLGIKMPSLPGGKAPDYTKVPENVRNQAPLGVPVMSAGEDKNLAPANRLRAGASPPAVMRGLEKANALADAVDQMGEAWANALSPIEMMAIEFSQTLGRGLKSLGGSLVEGLANAGSALVNVMRAGMGKLGDLISVTIEGFKSGGIWGAIGAAIAEIMQSAPSFATTLNLVAGIFKMLGGKLDRLVTSLQPLIVAVGELIGEVLDALAPVFNALGGVFKAIGPILKLVGVSLQALAPVFKVIAWVLDKVVTPIIGVIFDVSKWLVIATLNVARWLGGAWNSIVIELAKFSFTLGLNDLGNSLQSLVISMDGLDQVVADLNAVTMDGTAAAQEKAVADYAAAGAADDASKAVQNFAEQLTNVPTGYKVAAARYAAQDAQGSSDPAVAGGAAGGETRDWNLSAIVKGEDLLFVLDKQKRKQRFRMLGSPT